MEFINNSQKKLVIRQKYLPLIFFLVAYLLTCLTGLILLMHGPLFVQHLYLLFSGVRIDSLTSQQFINLVIVLYAPIIAFSASYILTTKASDKYFLNKNSSIRKSLVSISSHIKTPQILLFMCWSIAIFSFSRGNSFQNFSNWFTHDSWISSRWHLFETLTFFEFVNIYLFLPTLTSIQFLIYTKDKAYFKAVALFMLGLLLSLLLFQKKQAVIYIGLVLSTIWLSQPQEFVAISFKKILFSILIFIFIYSCLFFTPTLIKSLNEPLVRGDTKYEDIVAEKITNSGFFDFFQSQTVETTKSIYKNLSKPVQELLFFSNSFLFRTSTPAIFYIKTFPEKHQFYGLDLPFDNFSPDDNRVIWAEMWPLTPGGSVMSSFQFSLYSQVGLVGCVLFAGLTGALLSLLWIFGFFLKDLPHLYPTWKSLVLVLSVHLSIDSNRNSLFSSYGLGWGLLLIFCLGLINKLMNRNRNTP